jgi:serine protease Do
MKIVLTVLVVITTFVPQAHSHQKATLLAVKRVRPSVVSIFSYKSNTDGGYGSGVIIKSNGLVVTNAHVVRHGSKYLVRLVTGKTYHAKLIGLDPVRDIALLKIQSRRKFRAAKLGRSSTLVIGQTVIVIGNPYGLSHSVSKGIISALNRTIPISGTKSHNLIQTDAAINFGNSGGPMVNLRGRVIGIVVALHHGGGGLGFVIPIDIVKKVVKKILKNPSRYQKPKPKPTSIPKGLRKFLP